jgi:hypothetical protein
VGRSLPMVIPFVVAALTITSELVSQVTRGGDPAIPTKVVELVPSSDGWSKISNAFFTPTGGVLASDEVNVQVVRFAPTGSLLWMSARAGDGPGEFRRPEVVPDAGGDSIVVYDHRQAKVTILTPSGAFVRAMTTPPVSAGSGMVVPLRVLAKTSAGSFVIQAGRMYGADAPGIRRGKVALQVLDPSMEVTGTIDSVMGPTVLFSMYGQQRIHSELPFLARTHVMVRGDTLIALDGDRGLPRTYDLTRKRWGTVQMPQAPQAAVTRSQFGSWVDEVVAPVRDSTSRATTKRFLVEQFRTWYFPRVSGAALGLDGVFWTRAEPTLTTSELVSWEGRSSSAGSTLSVRLGRGCIIRDSRQPLLLVSCVDADGVPSLAILRLNPRVAP